MKKYIYILLVTLFSFTSCDILDLNPPTYFEESIKWESISNLDAYVRGFYLALYVNAEITGPNLTDGYADLIKFSHYNLGDTYHNKIVLDADYLNASNVTTLSPWSDSYNKIRQLNQFFIDVYQKDKAGLLNPEEVKVRLGEAHALRAFLYHELMIRHAGSSLGVILRVDNPSGELDGPAQRSKQRATKDECWDFIVEDYRKAIIYLPETWDTNNVGRLTRGAAWGLLARTALYAERWDVAIEAGMEVEKLANKGIYQLMPKYSDVFSVPNNKELIVTTNFCSPRFEHNFDTNFTPLGDDATQKIGSLGTPTEELAGAYDICLNGVWQPFSWNNAVHRAMPWTDRDPRFYSTILYNTAPWKGRYLELYVGGKDKFLEYDGSSSRDGERYSPTGYVIRKFLKENPSEDFIMTKSDQFWIEMRYSEILLILSEAYARKEDYSNAYKYLNKVRTGRTDETLRLNALNETSTWNDYFEDLEKERICELGIEGHRYWDLRRWKKARERINGKCVHALKITKTGTTYSYEVIDADKRSRFFPERYYVLPIPQAEITNNSACKQDPVW